MRHCQLAKSYCRDIVYPVTLYDNDHYAIYRCAYPSLSYMHIFMQLLHYHHFVVKRIGNCCLYFRKLGEPFCLWMNLFRLVTLHFTVLLPDAVCSGIYNYIASLGHFFSFATRHISTWYYQILCKNMIEISMQLIHLSELVWLHYKTIHSWI